MRDKPAVNTSYDSETYVIFKTSDYNVEFSEHSKPYIAINRANGDYTQLMDKSKEFGGFQNVPEDQIIPCCFLRYKKADNEFLLDDLCGQSSIQICKIETTTQGFKRQ